MTHEERTEILKNYPIRPKEPDPGFRERARLQASNILYPYRQRTIQLLSVMDAAYEYAGICLDGFHCGMEKAASGQLYFMDSGIYADPAGIGFAMPDPDPLSRKRGALRRKRYVFIYTGNSLAMYDMKESRTITPPAWAAEHFALQFDAFEARYLEKIDKIIQEREIMGESCQ